MEFKYYKARYKLERDKYQFILSKLSGNTWVAEGYYKDLFYLFKELVSRHVLDAADADSLVNSVNSACARLEKALGAISF